MQPSDSTLFGLLTIAVLLSCAILMALGFMIGWFSHKLKFKHKRIHSGENLYRKRIE